MEEKAKNIKLFLQGKLVIKIYLISGGLPCSSVWRPVLHFCMKFLEVFCKSVNSLRKGFWRKMGLDFFKMPLKSLINIAMKNVLLNKPGKVQNYGE